MLKVIGTFIPVGPVFVGSIGDYVDKKETERLADRIIDLQSFEKKIEQGKIQRRVYQPEYTEFDKSERYFVELLILHPLLPNMVVSFFSSFSVFMTSIYRFMGYGWITIHFLF